MEAPENTSKRPIEHHLIGVLGGVGEYVEGMEAAGQRQLVESAVLPRTRNLGDDDAFVDLGFEFGEAVDDLFRRATLPLGWRKEGSSHSMWSYVVDEKGYRRVQVFYKAAFYDRDAFMSLLSEANQKTGAQEEAYDRYSDEFPYRDRWMHDGWREGENYVWMFYQRHRDRMGEEIFDHAKYDRIGDPGFCDYRTAVEIVLAPDGGEVERR